MGSTALSGLDPLTSANSQGSPPQTCQQATLIKVIEVQVSIN